MSMLFLTALDMYGNEIQNAVMHPLATAPSNPKLGQYYYNSSDFMMYQWNGSAWKIVGVAVIDNLESDDATSALSAKQGKVLLEKINAINTNMEDPVTKEYADTLFETTESDTLTWDGNTEGLYEIGGMYRIAETTPTLADVTGKTAILLIGENSLNLSVTDMTADMGGVESYALMNAESGLMVQVFTADIPTYSIVKGIYVSEELLFPSSLTINGYTGFPTIKLKDECLPEHTHDYMTKADPTGTGSFSLNRKADTTIGDYSVAEGINTEAIGKASHAEGYQTIASGTASHAEGWGTIAASHNQTAMGKYNIEDAANTYAFMIGNGTSDDTRSNAFTVDWSGNGKFTGGISATTGTFSSTLTTTGTITSGSNLAATGYVLGTTGFYMKNGFSFWQQNASGVNRQMFIMNPSNQYFYGSGSYVHSEGAVYFDGNVVNLRSKGAINMTSVGTVDIYNGSTRIQFVPVSSSSCTSYFRNTADGKCALGNSDYRWYRVYATSATVQTSDERQKENIMPLGASPIMTLSLDEETTPIDIHSELFDRLIPVQYNLIEGDGKTCYGLIAQQVLSAMDELGFDEQELDLVHHEYHTNEETGEEKETFGIVYENLIPMCIHEIQKLKAEIATLKAE